MVVTFSVCIQSVVAAGDGVCMVMAQSTQTDRLMLIVNVA